MVLGGGGPTIASPSKDTTFLRDGICQAPNGWLKIIESANKFFFFF